MAGAGLRATLESAAIVSLTVTHGPYPQIGEVPGVRYVESRQDRDGEDVKLADDFFPYQKAGSGIAHLPDQNTVPHLLHRSRLALPHIPHMLRRNNSQLPAR